MKEKFEDGRKIIVILPTGPKRDLAPWEIEMQPNSSLLDPYKNLVPERPEKIEQSVLCIHEQALLNMNLRYFFSN